MFKYFVGLVFCSLFFLKALYAQNGKLLLGVEGGYSGVGISERLADNSYSGMYPRGSIAGIFSQYEFTKKFFLRANVTNINRHFKTGYRLGPSGLHIVQLKRHNVNFINYSLAVGTKLGKKKNFTFAIGSTINRLSDADIVTLQNCMLNRVGASTYLLKDRTEFGFGFSIGYQKNLSKRLNATWELRRNFGFKHITALGPNFNSNSLTGLLGIGYRLGQ